MFSSCGTKWNIVSLRKYIEYDTEPEKYCLYEDKRYNNILFVFVCDNRYNRIRVGGVDIKYLH